MITVSRASSSGVVQMIAADRASSGAIEEVVDKVVYHIIRNRL
jgi:hypothetical protein